MCESWILVIYRDIPGTKTPGSPNAASIPSAVGVVPEVEPRAVSWLSSNASSPSMSATSLEASLEALDDPDVGDGSSEVDALAESTD